MSHKVLLKSNAGKNSWSLLSNVLELAEKEKSLVKRGRKKEELYLLDSYFNEKNEKSEVINITGDNYRIDYIKSNKDKPIYLEYKEQIRGGSLLFLQVFEKGYLIVGCFDKETVQEHNLSFNLSMAEIKEKGFVPYEVFEFDEKRSCSIDDFIKTIKTTQRVKNDLEITYVRKREIK